MRYEFFILADLPPKKDGAQSMFGKPLEAKRLVKLRQAALEAFRGQPPLRSNIKLSIKVYVGQVNNMSTGDLDNFVTGICDGLMQADMRAKMDSIWSKPGMEDIHPSKTIAIVDDSQVVHIEAIKVVGDSHQQGYEIILEGEQ